MSEQADVVGASRKTSFGGWAAETLRTHQLSIASLSAYAVLVLCLWAYGMTERGFDRETAFPYMSQTSSFFGGFLYQADPLRIHTNFFYHLSYLLAKLAGCEGSYVPYQLVYAFLWLARGFLTFLIVRALLPGDPLLAFVCGALTIVHSSDLALNWIGQLHQFGFMFWMLLAIYLLVCGWTTVRTVPWLVLTVAALVPLYMSLWSYESQILIVFSVPVILYLVCRRREAKWWVTSALWWPLPVIYLIQAALRYRSGEATYQVSVTQSDLSAGGLLSDWIFNIAASLGFWRWQRTTSWYVSESLATLLGCLACVVFIVAGMLVWRLSARTLESDAGRALDARKFACVLGIGFVILALSFPAYLLLNLSRSLWRTQMLSSMGAALVFAGVAFLIGLVVRAESRRVVLILLLCGAIVLWGVRSGLKAGGVHRNGWLAHRAVMAQIVDLGPVRDRRAISLA